MDKLENPYVKIGVNIFLIRDNKILFGKRIGKVGYGTWCLPGGHFEYGETLIGAAKRELEEETGITTESLEFLHLINDPWQGTHYIHINFLAKEDFQGEVRVMEPDKFTEWKWFDINHLPEEIFCGHQKFIPTYLKKLIFVDNKDDS